ncbi:hypothetical protein BLOT_000990, partial [Blomia tropicalis]
MGLLIKSCWSHLSLLSIVCFTVVNTALLPLSTELDLVSTNANENICSQTCNQHYPHVQFEIGQTYTYDAKLNTQIENRVGDGIRNQEVSITTQVDISVYSPCELVLQLRQVHLTGTKNDSDLSQQLEKESVHFSYENGRVKHVCSSTNDEKWIVNIKKSIISSLQISTSNLSTKQTVYETDISGHCETIYEPISSIDLKTIIIRKEKLMTTCGQQNQFDIAFFPQKFGLDQVFQSAFPIFYSNATNECTQVINDKLIESSTCNERMKIKLLGIQVTSQIKVHFLEKKPTLIVQRLKRNFPKHRLSLSPNNAIFQPNQHIIRNYSVHEVQNLLEQICSKVITSIQLDVPVYFAELVNSLYSLSANEHVQLWEQIQSGKLCSSPKLLDIFLDGSALTGNEGSIEILLRAYQQDKINRQRANYLFSLLSFAKRPSLEAANRLVEFVRKQQEQEQIKNIPRGILFGITGFVRNLQVVQRKSNINEPKVDQLVETISSLLVNDFQLCVRQVSNQHQENQCLTIVFALKNLILYNHNNETKSSVVRELVQILQQTTSTQFNQEIRVVLVQILANAKINNQVRQFLLEQLLQNQQENIEIRIEAYKAIVMSGATTAQLEQVKQFVDRISGLVYQQELVNYIRSHQANLRTSSDTRKQTILPLNVPTFEKPSSQFIGISRNYELSYANEGLQFGVTAETDVIYDQKQSNQFTVMPQTVAFKFSVPIGGTEHQLIEIRLHQHGLDAVIARHLKKMRTSAQKNPWTVGKETLEYFIQHGGDILSENPEIRLAIQVSVDGKVILLADEQDFASGDFQQQSFVQELMANLYKKVTIDRAFAITPIDTVVQFPSLNGLPVQVRVNSSIVLGLKTDITMDVRDLSNSLAKFAVWPSVASQIETSVEFFAGSERKSIEYVQSFYSAPQLDLIGEMTNGRVISFKLNFPDNKHILGRWESQVFTRNEHGQRVRVNTLHHQTNPNQYDQNVHVCTQATRNVLGFVVCYDFLYSTLNDNSVDVVSEITIVKTDSKLKTYEFRFESPYSLEEIFATRGRPKTQQSSFGQLIPFKIVLNTPGSSIDREILFEIELPNSGSDQHKEARLRIQTPWKRVLLQGSVLNGVKERIVNMELSVDDYKFIEMELALETTHRGQKSEYRPRLKLQIDSLLDSPVNLAGSLIYNQGRKGYLHFQLDDIQQKKQYIEGTFIQEQGNKKTYFGIRNSAYLVVNLIGINAKLAGSFELAERFVQLDLGTEYKLQSWNKPESAKIVLKLQNLSSGKVLKLSSFGMLKLSQYSQHQVKFSHNILYVFSDQFEHDFKLGWAEDAEDEQIRLYQSLNKKSQRGQTDIESALIIVYRPQNINYEIRGTAALIGFGTNENKNYNVVVNGLSHNSKNSDSNFHGEFSYLHLSKLPLKMKMQASLKSKKFDLLYKDEIEEKSPSKYRGHLMVQLNSEQKYEGDYDYEVKGNNLKSGFEEHEFNVEMKNVNSSSVIRHHGLLRMDGTKSMSIRSKLSGDDIGDIYDGKLKLKDNLMNLNFNHIPHDVKVIMQIDFDKSQPSGQLEYTSPTFKHESDFELIPKKSLQFNSRTKRNNENVFSVDGKFIHDKQRHQFSVKSNPFNGGFKLEYPQEGEQTIQFHGQLPKSWSQETSLVRHSSKPMLMQLSSSTKYDQSNLIDFSTKYDPNDTNYIKLNTPLIRTNLDAQYDSKQKTFKKTEFNFDTERYSHQCKCLKNLQNSPLDCDSSTYKSGKLIAKFRYKRSINGAHNFELESPQMIKAFGDYNFDETVQKPYAMINLRLTDKDGQDYQHKTKIVGIRHDDGKLDTLSLTSKTTKSDKDLAKFDANMSKSSNYKSTASLQIGNNLQAKIVLDPYQNCEIKVDSPSYNHLTELSYEPEDGGQRVWNVRSSTTSPKNKFKRYSLELKHHPNQVSSFELDFPNSNSKLTYVKPQSTNDKHQVNFVFNGTFSNDNIESNIYEHNTEMSYKPYMAQFNLDSTTQHDGEPFVKVDSFISTNAAEKSHLNFNIGNKDTWKGQLELEPNYRQARFNFDALPYKHRSEFSNENGYQLKTLTTKGPQNVFELNGLLNPSYENKFGKISLKSDKWKHDSTFKYGKNALFKTDTTYDDKTLNKVEAQLDGLMGSNKIEFHLPGLKVETILNLPAKQCSMKLNHTKMAGSVLINHEVDADHSFHFDLNWDKNRHPNANVQLDMSIKRMSVLEKNEHFIVVLSGEYAGNKLMFNSDLVPESPIQNPIQISLAYIPIELINSWQFVYTHAMESDKHYQCKWDFFNEKQLKYELILTHEMTTEKIQFGLQTIAPQYPHLQMTVTVIAGIRKPNELYFLHGTAVHNNLDRYQLLIDIFKHSETRKLDGNMEFHVPTYGSHRANFTINLTEKLFTLDVINENTGKQVDVYVSYAENLFHLNAISNIALLPIVDLNIYYTPGVELNAKFDLDKVTKFDLAIKYTGEISTLQFYVLTKVDSVYTPSLEIVAEGRKSPEEGNHERLIAFTGRYNTIEMFKIKFNQDELNQWTLRGQMTSFSNEQLIQFEIEAKPIDLNQRQFEFKFIPSFGHSFLAHVNERRPTMENDFIRSVKLDIDYLPEQKNVFSTEIFLKHRTWSEIPQSAKISLEHFPSNTQGLLQLSIHEVIDVDNNEFSSQSLFDNVKHHNGIVLSKKILQKVLDQAVFKWNNKSIGLALMTNQFEINDYTGEHELKIYLPLENEQMVQLRWAHQISSNLYFFKQQLRTDLKRQTSPVYEFTILINKDSQMGSFGQIEMDSHKFTRSPKMLEFVIQPSVPSKPLDCKVRLDIGQHEDDAVTFMLVSEYSDKLVSGDIVGDHVNQNRSLHFSVKGQRQTDLDFSVDTHVSDSSIGLLWQNMNRHGKMQQGYYSLRFIETGKFEAIFANPGVKHEMNGTYKLDDYENKFIMDFVLQKFVDKFHSWSSQTPEPVLIQKHQVHLEQSDNCIRTLIEDVKTTERNSKRQINICTNFDKANLVNIEVNSFIDGQKTTEFNAQIDARSAIQALRLSFQWNPEYFSKILNTMLNLKDFNQQEFIEQLAHNEFVQELIHKYNIIGEKLIYNFTKESFIKIFIEEIFPIIEEFGFNKQIIDQLIDIILEPVIHNWQTARRLVTEIFDEWKHTFDQWINEWILSCHQSNTCVRFTQMINAIENSEHLSQMIAEYAVQWLKDTHDFVAHSNGKLVQNFKCVSNVIRRILFNSQNPLHGIFNHIESIINELFQTSNWRNVQWERVQNSIEQAIRLLASPSNWQSSIRVLHWDPSNGHVQLEIKTPKIVSNWSQQRTQSVQPKKSLGNLRMHDDSTILVRKTRSLMELTYSIISGGSPDNEQFKPSRILPDSPNSNVKLDFIWIEQQLARNLTIFRNIPSINSSSHCKINSSINKKDNGININILQAKFRNHKPFINIVTKNKTWINLKIEELNLDLNSNLNWWLNNSKLKNNDSIMIVGKTIQIKILRPFLIVNFEEICSFFTEMQFDLTSLQSHKPHSSELSFYSREKNSWMKFTNLYRNEIAENFADNNETIMIKNQTKRELSCIQWLMLNHIRIVDQEMQICRVIKDGCNLAAYFVDRQEMVRVPNQCLACSLEKDATTSKDSPKFAKFGTRRVVHSSDMAQIIFVLDGSCHQKPLYTIRFMHQLNRLSKLIDKEFKIKRIKTRFNIIAPDEEGKYKQSWSTFEKRFNYSHFLSRESFVNPNITSSARFSLDPFMQSVWPSNGKNSFDFLQLFSYPPGKTSRHFIVIDCLNNQLQNHSKSISSCIENEIDFSTARTMFLHSNNFIHLISGFGISRRQMNSPKLRRVIGLDWGQVFFDNETAIMNNRSTVGLVQMSRLLRGHVLPQRDICHVLTLETNGSVFSNRILKQANRRIFAKRLVDNINTATRMVKSNSKEDECYRCDCMLNKDRLSAHEECVLCQDRKHTLPYRSRTSGGP